MPNIRLDKFLTCSGIASRRDAREYIKKGLVSVNNSNNLKSEQKINTDIDIVCFNNKPIYYEKYKYIMLNKPTGVISATKDDYKKTVIDLLDDIYKPFNLFPVGRLDKDTVGLVILSNDGAFAHNTLSPKKHIEKKYIAHLDGYIDNSYILKFKEGVLIDSKYKCLPAKLNILYASDALSKVEITIKEGKYHQIKKMFGAFYKKVIYLKRVSFGDISLDEGLAEGSYRELNKNEMMLIHKYLGS